MAILKVEVGTSMKEAIEDIRKGKAGEAFSALYWNYSIAFPYRSIAAGVSLR
jgi:hypothetical protein